MHPRRLRGLGTRRRRPAPVSERSRLAQIAAFLGPGFVTGTSDDDPSAIGTYAQAGAGFGLALLWTAAISFPFMATVQEMSGRVGLVTGKSLATIVRREYARPVLFTVVALQAITNAINIGADLGAMAQSAQLLAPLAYPVMLAIVTAATVALIVFVPYRTYAFYLKFLGLSLLTYVASAIAVQTDWERVLRATFIPTIRFDHAFALTLVAVFGTTISPYEFFWQASEEVEELIDKGKIGSESTRGRPHTTERQIAHLRWDTILGMFFSNAVAYFIILTAAATLHAHGITNVASAVEAAKALRPLAGPYAATLFALGIVSAGLLSVPVIAASSAYALGGAFDFARSLARPFWQEPAFYAVIVGSIVAGIATTFLPISPFALLFYSAVLNGAIAPAMLFVLVSVSGKRSIMGHFANSAATNAVGWTLFAAMTLMVVALVALSL